VFEQDQPGELNHVDRVLFIQKRMEGYAIYIDN
jgi:hypothetical protein